MSYFKPFVRLTFGGELADGNDIWSCGFAIANLNGNGLSEDLFNVVSDNLEDIGALIETFVGDSATRVPNNVKVYWTKAALIGENGKYLRPPTEIPLNWGGAVNAPYSPQDAMVCTLESEIWKDPGKYNRFYLPTAGPAGTNEWHLSTAEQTAFLAAFKTFVDGINDLLTPGATDINPRVAVVSNTGTGKQSPVVNLRLGQIVDTQRRRRNALSEDYATVAVNPI